MLKNAILVVDTEKYIFPVTAIVSTNNSANRYPEIVLN